MAVSFAIFSPGLSFQNSKLAWHQKCILYTDRKISQKSYLFLVWWVEKVFLWVRVENFSGFVCVFHFLSPTPATKHSYSSAEEPAARKASIIRKENSLTRRTVLWDHWRDHFCLFFHPLWSWDPGGWWSQIMWQSRERTESKKERSLGARKLGISQGTGSQ